jgi:hypothetical protein
VTAPFVPEGAEPEALDVPVELALLFMEVIMPELVPVPAAPVPSAVPVPVAALETVPVPAAPVVLSVPDADAAAVFVPVPAAPVPVAVTLPDAVPVAAAESVVLLLVSALAVSEAVAPAPANATANSFAYGSSVVMGGAPSAESTHVATWSAPMSHESRTD